MTPLARRALYYIIALAGATLGFTLLYSIGMAVLEDRPRPWYHALEVVVQSFTTTGYGQDAPWETLKMSLLMIAMQLTGIGFILSAVDIFIVPWLRDTLRPTAPRTHPDVQGHVVVCGFTERTSVLIDDLEEAGHSYIVLESEKECANTLHDEGYTTIHGSGESVAALHRTHIATARALVVDVADDVNASIVLAAREAHSECTVITFIKDLSLARYHRAAGATTILSPRQLVGNELGTLIRSESAPTATVVIAGFGEAGQSAHEALRDHVESVVVLDSVKGPNVDYVGDARKPEVLQETGLQQAEAFIITVGDDTTATFAALVARNLNPSITIAARVDSSDMVENLRRAGADHIRALAEVSGHMLTEAIFDDNFAPPSPHKEAQS